MDMPKSRVEMSGTKGTTFADMAELADAPDLGSGGNPVQVQVLLSALNGAKPNPVYFFKKVFAVVVKYHRK